MPDTLTVGLTGAGGLGTALGEQFADVPDAAVAAVADVDADARAAAGDRFDVPARRQYADHEAMLDDAAPDSVVIATPHTFHYDQVVAALDRDVHTLCEKPLCIDLDHARDLVDRVEASETVLQVGYQRHLSPVYRAARERLPDVAGDPTYVTAEVTQDWIAGQRDAWRGDPDLSGGGQLYDTGSHLLDVVCWVTDCTPERVDAQMVFDDDAGRVDKQAVLNVEFAEGAVASIAVSGDTPRTREHLHVWGPDGAVYVEGEDWDPRDLSLIDDDGTVTYPSLDDYDHESKAAAFAECVRGDREPPATARDALAVTALTEAAYESARSGERVAVDL
jgi:predicted dehydrogenase